MERWAKASKQVDSNRVWLPSRRQLFSSGILPYRGSGWQITQSIKRLQNGKTRTKKYNAYTQFIYRRPQDVPGEPQDVTNSK